MNKIVYQAGHDDINAPKRISYVQEKEEEKVSIILTQEQLNYLRNLVDNELKYEREWTPQDIKMVSDLQNLLQSNVYLNADGKPVVHTVDDVRKFIQLYPEHLMMMPWHQMIHDMDHCGEEYTMTDFWQEMTVAYLDVP